MNQERKKNERIVNEYQNKIRNQNKQFVEDGLAELFAAFESNDWNKFNNILDDITKKEVSLGAGILVLDAFITEPDYLTRILTEEKKLPLETIVLISTRVMRGVLDNWQKRPDIIYQLTKHLNKEESRQYLIQCLAHTGIFFEDDEVICRILKYDFNDLSKEEKEFINQYHEFHDLLYDLKVDRDYDYKARDNIHLFNKEKTIMLDTLLSNIEATSITPEDKTLASKIRKQIASNNYYLEMENIKPLENSMRARGVELTQSLVTEINKSLALDYFFESLEKAKTLEKMRECIEKYKQNPHLKDKPIQKQLNNMLSTIEKLIQLNNDLTKAAEYEKQITKDSRQLSSSNVQTDDESTSESDSTIEETSKEEENTEVTEFIDSLNGKKLEFTTEAKALLKKPETDKINFLEQCMLKLEIPLTSEEVGLIFEVSKVNEEDKEKISSSLSKFNVTMQSLRADIIRLEQEISDYEGENPRMNKLRDPEKIQLARTKVKALKTLITELRNQNNLTDAQQVLLKASKNQDLIGNRPTALIGKHIQPGPKWFRVFRGKIDPTTKQRSESTTHNHLINLRKSLGDIKTVLKEAEQHARRKSIQL